MPMLPLPLSRTTSASMRPLPSTLTTALLLALSAGAVSPVAAQQATGGDAMRRRRWTAWSSPARACAG